MIEMLETIKRYWFTIGGELMTTNLTDRLTGGEFILVTKIDDGNYTSRWKNKSNTWKKLWFSDLKDGKLQFMPGSTEEEERLMQRMYREILAHEILEK